MGQELKFTTLGDVRPDAIRADPAAFGEAKSDWTIAEIATELECRSATVYRTVRDLLAESFLEPATEGHTGWVRPSSPSIA